MDMLYGPPRGADKYCIRSVLDTRALIRQGISRYALCPYYYLQTTDPYRGYRRFIGVCSAGTVLEGKEVGRGKRGGGGIEEGVVSSKEPGGDRGMNVNSRSE